MMRRFVGGIAIVMAVLPFFTTPVSAAGSDSCNKRLLTAPAWYRGVTDNECNVSLESVAENPDLGGKIGPFILIVGLNIVEIMMHLVAYISLGFIIYGGFRYMTSNGSPDKSVSARKTITNAIIGLIISIIAVAVISFIVERLM